MDLAAEQKGYDSISCKQSKKRKENKKNTKNKEDEGNDKRMIQKRNEKKDAKKRGRRIICISFKESRMRGKKQSKREERRKRKKKRMEEEGTKCNERKGRAMIRMMRVKREQAETQE